ncbi:MAG: hypothetical protein IT350_13600 [Deltaproteobacteria bacterium]|nr:hypothetical protein [Deltaproteobacteria bacterium]
MLTLDEKWSARASAIPVGAGGYRVVDVTLAHGDVVSDCIVIDAIWLKPPQDAPTFTLEDIRDISAAARPKRFLAVTM